jgi:glycosyltransferase
LVDFLAGGASSGLKSVLLANIECLGSRRKHLGAPFIDLAFFLKPGLKLRQWDWT